MSALGTVTDRVAGALDVKSEYPASRFTLTRAGRGKSLNFSSLSDRRRSEHF